MSIRSRVYYIIMCALCCVAVVAASCGGDQQSERTESVSAPVEIPTLTPPEPFVLAADGTTRKTLEQAGILKPGGKRWALVMGKALFWDERVGSDGNACASCHFHAGADTRLTNQLNPGMHDLTKGPNGDRGFGSVRSDVEPPVKAGHMPSGAEAGANYTLKPADMPLHKLSDESNRNSTIVTTTNDRVSSMGSYHGTFTKARSVGKGDRCGRADASTFKVGSLAARRVEPRNTPTIHNAAFNNRNFWDNRANSTFNGVGVFGMRDIVGDPNKRLIVATESGEPSLGFLQVENASTASQAIGPPLSSLEMACEGRTFPDFARRVLSVVPLFKQRVSKSDSVLGAYASESGRGLAPRYSYTELIKQAFDPKYWSLKGKYRIVDGQLVEDATGYTQMEINFSMFFGLAILEYEATQVSDKSEFDRLQAEGRLTMRPNFAPNAGRCTTTELDPVDPLLVRGCTIFARAPQRGVPTTDGIRGGGCFTCHNRPGGGVGVQRQPMLSEASFQKGETFPFFLTFPDVNGVTDIRDNGSANIGLRPVFSDLNSGGTDDYGHPLSYARQYWNYLKNGRDMGRIFDAELRRAIEAGLTPPEANFAKVAVDGATKVPILRNVALTPPYFSWGGYPSLRQVLKVYNRGMNRRDITGAGSVEAHGSGCTRGDDSGSGPDGNQRWPVHGDDCSTNTAGAIVPLGLLDCDRADSGCDPKSDDLAALERFLKSLTDRRVQCDQAPFDHPELTIVVGHKTTDANKDGSADDITFAIPAVGAAGYDAASGFCIPNAGDLFAPGMQARSGGARVPLRSE